MTIVVPVHNALLQALQCLDALVHTVGNRARVLVIDDASSDPDVAPALTSVADKAGFELVTNTENLGFVGTCNRAFSLITTGHVLLLNSDTRPQTGWLEAMLTAVDDDVASVTASSNNATIYSLPSPGVDPFSSDFGAEELAEIVRSVLPHQSIEIPVGVGFCFLLTRKALDEIGGFDPAYGMGYGEEDDWCMRATRAGFKHLLAPSAFVFHEGGASMSASGVLAKGIGTHPENEKLLHSRYPDYPRLVSAFVEQPTIHLMRDRVAEEILRRLSQRRPRILHWMHADPLGRHAGGTEHSLRRLLEALSGEFAMTVVYPAGDGSISVLETANGVTRRRSMPVPAHDPVDQTDMADMWREFAGVLCELIQPDVFHFHHGHATNPSVALAAIDAGIPTVVTLHDFNLICPRNHLLDRWGSYCGIPETPDVCDACLGSLPDSIGMWRLTSQLLLNRADRVIVPDPTVAELMGKAITMPSTEKIEVIEPIGADVAPSTIVPPANRTVKRRVLIPGRIEAPHKGGLLIDELIQRLVSHDIEVHSAGSDDVQKRDRVVVHGTYDPGGLAPLVENIDADFGIIPSIVPETFSLTLSELWAAGIPVLAGNAGAIARRILRTGAGWVTDTADAGSLAHAVLEILGNPVGLERARNNALIEAHRLVGTNEKAIERHRVIYRELAATQRDLRGVKGGATSRRSL